MPRDGAIIFSDLIGKLDGLRVACDKCGRDGSYGLKGASSRRSSTRPIRGSCVFGLYSFSRKQLQTY